MSHFSVLPTKIADVALLEASLKELGLRVERDAFVRGDSCRQLQAEVVAVLEGNYDLGWSRNSNGTYDLIGDLWGVARKHNQAELISAINQKYAVGKVLAQVQQTGHTVVTQSVGVNGSYQVVVTR